MDLKECRTAKRICLIAAELNLLSTTTVFLLVQKKSEQRNLGSRNCYCQSKLLNLLPNSNLKIFVEVIECFSILQIKFCLIKSETIYYSKLVTHEISIFN